MLVLCLNLGCKKVTRQICITLDLGVSWKRKDTEGGQGKDECEGDEEREMWMEVE